MLVISDFVGRSRELRLLQKRIDRVARSGRGAALAIRGRRQVGKSRLVQEFCDRSELPYCFWAASKGAGPALAVDAFITELRESTLSGAGEIPSVRAGSWPDALRALAGLLPGTPSIVVLDEIPWISEQDPVFDGALQTAWDRALSSKPVLLLLLGSDMHMMERFTAYDQPFYGRADMLRLPPLDPAEVASVTGLEAADALDAHLVSGGLPGVLRDWEHGATALDFIRTECEDPGSALFGVPQQALMAEFPAPDHTRRVFEAIGGGARTRQNIASAAGSAEAALPSGALTPILRRLAHEKQVVAEDHPISTRPGKPMLYRISDSNLRFYLACLRHASQQVQRGRPEAAFRYVRRQWESWRGRAIEPLVQESLQIAASTGDLPWDGVEAVGGWWNRQFDPEIDLVGADRGPIARKIGFVGSIKWLSSPFDGHDRDELMRSAAQVPGFTEHLTGTVVVTRSGIDDRAAEGIDIVWRPEDVLAAWQR